MVETLMSNCIDVHVACMNNVHATETFYEIMLLKVQLPFVIYVVRYLFKFYL